MPSKKKQIADGKRLWEQYLAKARACELGSAEWDAWMARADRAAAAVRRLGGQVSR